MYRRVKELDQGHSATMWKNQDSNLGCQVPKPITINSMLMTKSDIY